MPSASKHLDDPRDLPWPSWSCTQTAHKASLHNRSAAAGNQRCCSAQKRGLLLAELPSKGAPSWSFFLRFYFLLPSKACVCLVPTPRATCVQVHTPLPRLNALWWLPRPRERCGGCWTCWQIAPRHPAELEADPPPQPPRYAGLCLPLAGRGRRCHGPPVPAPGSCSWGGARQGSGRLRRKRAHVPAASEQTSSFIPSLPERPRARSDQTWLYWNSPPALLPSRHFPKAPWPARGRRAAPPPLDARWRPGAPEEAAPGLRRQVPSLSTGWQNGRECRQKGISAGAAEEHSCSLAYRQD